MIEAVLISDLACTCLQLPTCLACLQGKLTWKLMTAFHHLPRHLLVVLHCPLRPLQTRAWLALHPLLLATTIHKPTAALATKGLCFQLLPMSERLQCIRCSCLCITFLFLMSCIIGSRQQPWCGVLGVGVACHPENAVRVVCSVVCTAA